MDSFHFMALLNGKDAAHRRAMDTQAQLQGRLVTTEFVLLEVGDAFADPSDRPALLELFDDSARPTAREEAFANLSELNESPFSQLVLDSRILQSQPKANERFRHNFHVPEPSCP